MENKPRIRCGLSAFLLTLGMWFMTSVTAATTEPAGFVLMSAGGFNAAQPNGVLRKLERKSPFYPGEVLRTGADSRAQVRFRDGSLISLKPATEIRIDEFRFDDPVKGEDRNIFTLINGGFRTITGKIGKKNPDNYQMKSSVASIGVRGTTYEVVLNKGMSVAAWQGQIIVTNESGKMALGEGAAYNFAMIGNSKALPEGLLHPPKALQQSESETITSSTDRASDAGGSTDSHDNTAGSDGVLGVETSTVKDTAIIAATQTQGAISGSTETIQTLTYPPPSPATTPALTGDQRLVGVTLDRVGMAVRGGSGFSGLLVGGIASDGTSGSPVITDNGLDPSQAGFYTTPAVSVLKQGNATLQSSSLQSIVVDAASTVTWGVWQGTAASPAQLQTDMFDPSVFSVIDGPVFWATATPTVNTSLASRTGAVSYRNVMNFVGGSNSGAISNLYVNLGIDFNSAVATGKVHLYTPTEFWDINLSGMIAAPTLNFTSVAGSVNGTAGVQGSFDSLFTGGNGSAILSAFDFQSPGSPALHVEGLALVNDMPVGNLKLTATESASLDRIGIAMISNNATGRNWVAGAASNIATGGALFTDNGLLPGNAGFTSAYPVKLLYQQSAPVTSYSHASLPVSWGIWDGVASPATLYTDPDDPMISQAVNNKIVWLTVIPTLDSTVAGATGSARYASASAFGNSDIGSMYWHTNDLDVNFDLGTFFGYLSVNVDALLSNTWNVKYSGNIVGSRLNVTNYSGIYNGSAGSNLAVNGDVVMTFTGVSVDAIAGAFDLELATNPAIFAQGAFVADRDLRLTFAEASAMNHVGILASTYHPAIVEHATSGAGASTPIFGLNGQAPGTDLFNVGHFNEIMRKDLAIETKAAAYQVAANAAYEVNWGSWNGSTNQYKGYLDPLNPSVASNIYGNTLYWMTLIPTPDTAIASLKASNAVITYNQPFNIVGGGASPISAATFNFSAMLNFNTGAISGGGTSGGGTMSFMEGALLWDVQNIAGNLSQGAAINVSGISGLHNGNAIQGNMNLVLTGPNAEAVGGGFRIWETINSTQMVEGVFLTCKSGGC